MTEQKKHLSYTFYRISIALAVFIAFFLQTFLLVDGTNIFMSHFTQWNAREVSLPITIGGYIAIVTTFLIGSWLIRHNGRGMMLALITNITAFMSIFRVMGRGIGELKKCRAGFERIEPYFGRETEESQKEKIDVDKLEWKVTQLSYAYGKKVGMHLQNLEYSGEKNLFLIGEKGAGKSTFTKIMLGLYRDYQGSFLCNGVELKEIS